ncbi:excalibur calcium-binding domain-containing protein [Flavobacterium sp. HJSW_4]|uniref:excalibur calcium-binding domain-containing protein n=1 Tax=Flavobacterium sp. HJSW_4 TaxID=3344660 RepID=UPI0035F43BE0
MKHKKIIAISISLLTFTGIIISCSDSGDSTEITSSSNSGSSSNCPTKTCADFKSQADAQKTFDSNKSCYKNLDADGDGKACESLK